MKNDENGRRVLRFGEFSLDLVGQCLRRNGQRVRLRPKPFETLTFLIEHRHETVTKDQILETVWADTPVTDGALVQAIREVRRTLDDDDKEPRFIKTIPRTGYRFIAEVVEETAARAADPAAAVTLAAAASSPAPWRWTWAAGGLALVGAALGGLIASWPWKAAEETQSPLVFTSGNTLRQLTTAPLYGVKPAYSPDGRHVLFLSSSVDSRGNLDLFRMPAGGGPAQRLTDLANATGDLPVFTADGSRVVFSRFRNGEDGTRLPDLWIVDASGGTPALLMADASGAGFSPDGRWMAYTKYVAGHAPLWMSPVGRLDEHREVAARGFNPRWSPDGRWIAYTTSDPQGGSGMLWMAPRSLEDPVQLTSEAEDMYGLAWTADSESVIIASNRAGDGWQLRQVPISGGPARALTSGVGHYLAPSVAPGGHAVIFAHLSPFPTFAVADGVVDGELRRLDTGDHHIGHLWPRLSPSATRIASVGRPHQGERLWITDVASGARICAGDRLASHPSWLDDERVAYLSAADVSDDVSAVHVMGVAACASTKWTDLGVKAVSLAVHPSGTALAFVSRTTDGGQRILLRDMATGADQLVAAGSYYDALRWNPDGSTLAWSGPIEAGNVASNGIWVAEPGRSTPRQLVKDGYAPAWSDDGRRLYFARRRIDKGEGGLWRVDLTHGEPTRVRSWNLLTYYDVVESRLVIAANETACQIFEMRADP